KRDIDDMRESPALDVMRRLEERGARVQYHDPHVARFQEDGHAMASVPLTPELLAAVDAVVIITDHSCVDYRNIGAHASLVVDTRNVMASLGATRARVVTLTSARPVTGAVTE
ncbi:MAG: UDP binding domain-containing protein, partial [Gemmatimonadota bacterium]|nr:UDP binding domain-containing protein [Gemmatimonadota bacterium]